ncbi:aspartate kinase [Faecalicatena orotica]|uniref:Aspartokinase n=2 Tax=Bacillota TaxID=1239 RepID=A0A2Y9BGX1_9FIRM|nr:aspartate kinase [Faecalicatena orotica]SSA54874.1 aspartate kinase [Faecalicatena orotica]
MYREREKSKVFVTANARSVGTVTWIPFIGYWRKRGMKKVVKFGGSSLASAEQFKKVGEIIRSDGSRRYVVPSAPGKRFSNDTKVTDMLYTCYGAAMKEKNFTDLLSAIQNRYNEIIEGLNLTLSLDKDFEIIRENFGKKAGRDYAASRGEYLNSKIMAAYLGFEFIDAAEVVRFNEDGSFNDDVTNTLLSGRLDKTEYAVIPGFYGAKEDGTVVTFSRGGSDVTGSLVALAASADLYENWTDVSGFLIADPRIVKNPKSIETITYKELRELSYMGASVLHEDAIFPVRKAGIPINIRNTNAPQDKGTLIVEGTCRQPKYTITGIAGTDGFASITVEKAMMNSEIGFCRKVLQVFEENEVSIEHMPSGIDTMTIFVHKDEFEEKEQQVLAGIHKAVDPDHIELESDLALIAIVGRGMRATRGTAGRIFSALAHAHINVKMIDQGSSELNIIVGVRHDDFKNAIRALYEIFVLTQI